MRVQRLNLLPWLVLAFACATAPPPPPPDPGPQPFSGELAYAQLERLVALGPRVAGSPAGAQARTLMRSERDRRRLAEEVLALAGEVLPVAAP